MCKNSCSTIVNQVLLVQLLSCTPDGYKKPFSACIICMLYAVQWPCLYITYRLEGNG